MRWLLVLDVLHLHLTACPFFFVLGFVHVLLCTPLLPEGPELQLLGDAPPSLWGSDTRKPLSQLVSPPPTLTPPPTPPPPPCYTPPHCRIPPPPYYSPQATSPSMPPQVSPPSYSTPPPKIVPMDAETPPWAKATDPITPRTEQWLTQSLQSLNGCFDMGWARYRFAMRWRGQVALLQGGGSGFPALTYWTAV